MVDDLITKSIITQLGTTGIFAIITIRAIMLLYRDMRQDKVEYEKQSKLREEALMRNLETQTKTNIEICKSLERMDSRLLKVEKILEKE